MKKTDIAQAQKNIATRYILLILLIISFLSKPFTDSLIITITYLSYIVLSLFTDIKLLSDLTLQLKNNIFIIIKECVAPSAYLLISIIFFTLPLEIKKIFKIWLSSIAIFTIFNILRIFLLIYVATTFGAELFEKVHLLFYEFISAIVVALIIIYYLRKEKIKKTYPIVSDIKFLIKQIKKK